MTKKDDNVHDDDEKDEENVVSYEISSETLTRRGWSQQAKLEQEGRNSRGEEVNIVNDIASPNYTSFDILQGSQRRGYYVF